MVSVPAEIAGRFEGSQNDHEDRKKYNLIATSLVVVDVKIKSDPNSGRRGNRMLVCLSRPSCEHELNVLFCQRHLLTTILNQV